eukprot:TRINITY_DN11528_c0_g1_i1.p1 TRINITY_DN11528_c0_g1~~TRINITY_DN11528_c0_g1_i1.p1  ORF type:complete len:525 (-),score=69.60 TRINITY_DN11528_c0_g1_i1:206-1780(-)
MQQGQPPTCEVCGISEEEVGDEFHSWKCMYSKEIRYVCGDCLRDGQVETRILDEDGSHRYFFPGFRVLSHCGEEELEGCVWKYDNETCEVEWDDKSKGVTSKRIDEVKQIMKLDMYGDIVRLGYEYSSLEEFLSKRGNRELKLEYVQILDNLIPQKLTASLVQHLSVLAESPYQDFHPGSDGKVLNLFHPSLYCYVKGQSTLKDGSVEEFFMFDEVEDAFGREMQVSMYQWLPTNFEIDKYGRANIRGYINGLGFREEYPELFKDIEQIFTYFVPQIDACLTQLIQSMEYGFYDDFEGLSNTVVQVVCKASNYILQPGQEHEGVWHVEGMCHEHIVATGIFYYDMSDNMVDEGLQFRREIDEEEEELVIMEYRHEDPPPFDYSRRVVELGTIETKKGRCIVFPNCYQHKLIKLRNQHKTKVAYRRMLVFFIVNPQRKILSTQDVQNQNWAKLKGVQAIEIQKVARKILGQSLPEAINQKIINSAKMGFTLEEAQQHRLGLMEDRKYFKDELNNSVEREIELCEH